MTPFNSLPPVPPDQEIVETAWETKAILRKAISANRALALLRSKSAHLPNPVLLIDNLSLLEAKASSEIENIFTTHDKLFQADARREGNLDPQTKEVLRYKDALWQGVELIRERPLSTNLFVALVQTLKGNQSHIRQTPGTKIATPEGRVIYTPPEGEAVIRDMLRNLEDFIHAEMPLDPLIVMAVVHYQFEAIHPFTDGNGRTGRILNILFLMHAGLLDLPVLFLSGYTISNKAGYYHCLEGVTERGAWEPWILYMLEAVEQTSIQTLHLVEEIYALMIECQRVLQDHAPKIYSKDLVELIFRSPFCRINNPIAAGMMTSRITAKKHLSELVRLGYLRESKIGVELIYVNERLLSLLKRQ